MKMKPSLANSCLTYRYNYNDPKANNVVELLPTVTEKLTEKGKHIIHK